METASDNLLSAELSVDDAENTMDNYTITAPISGTIIQKNVQAGETVGGDSTTAATAMCIIHDLSYLEMTLNVGRAADPVDAGWARMCRSGPTPSPTRPSTGW